MKPFFNLLTESDGEGKGNGEGEELQEFSVYKISSSLKIILLGLFFFPLSVVGTSFGPAERGIQP